MWAPPASMHALMRLGIVAQRRLKYPRSLVTAVKWKRIFCSNSLWLPHLGPLHNRRSTSAHTGSIKLRSHEWPGQSMSSTLLSRSLFKVSGPLCKFDWSCCQT